MFKKIISQDNLLIKHILTLEKARERKTHQQFTVEGKREISLAIQSGWEIQNLLFCPDYFTTDEMEAFINKHHLQKADITEVSEKIFYKLTYRAQYAGMLAVVSSRELRIQSLQLSGNPLILILENVEKPGNIGAILRTCDAAAVDALLICDAQTDIYNPNICRSSLGALFTVPIALCSSEEAIRFCRNNRMEIVGSSLQTKAIYSEIDYTHPVALVMGAEAEGLSSEWTEHADHLVKIPMKGKVDSLNVSNAAAILIFEVVRQRG